LVDGKRSTRSKTISFVSNIFVGGNRRTRGKTTQASH